MEAPSVPSSVGFTMLWISATVPVRSLISRQGQERLLDLDSSSCRSLVDTAGGDPRHKASQ